MQPFSISVPVIAIIVELCQSVYSPTCAIHALFCMSTKVFFFKAFTMLSSEFVPMSLIAADIQAHTSFKQAKPKGAL